MNAFAMIAACAHGQRHESPALAKCQDCGTVEPIVGDRHANTYVCATCALKNGVSWFA